MQEVNQTQKQKNQALRSRAQIIKLKYIIFRLIINKNDSYSVVNMSLKSSSKVEFSTQLSVEVFKLLNPKGHHCKLKIFISKVMLLKDNLIIPFL